MDIKTLKRFLTINFKNIPGWSTKRKIVVFISDDWGDQRIRSEKEYHKLIEYGLPLDKSIITRVDTLATSEDLYKLYEVLNSVTDLNGRSAVFSPFMIMANPDYEKIKESNFQKYFYKDFSEMIKQQGNSKETIRAWDKGINEKIFLPEYHGRDHLNIPLWLNALRKGNKDLEFCFDHHFAHFKTPEMNVSPAEAFYFDSQKSFEFLEHSLKDGIRLFSYFFNRKPKVFNPPNGVFHTDFYPALSDSGIETVATQHYRKEPSKNGALTKRRCKFGEVSDNGIIHFISNCAFEPTKEGYSGIKETENQIEAAFRWNKPALINTHRVNYVGGRSTKIRDKGLLELEKLLKLITDKWPDVEFMSAGEFSDELSKSVMSKVSA